MPLPKNTMIYNSIANLGNLMLFNIFQEHPNLIHQQTSIFLSRLETIQMFLSNTCLHIQIIQFPQRLSKIGPIVCKETFGLIHLGQLNLQALMLTSFQEITRIIRSTPHAFFMILQLQLRRFCFKMYVNQQHRPNQLKIQQSLNHHLLLNQY